LSPSDLDLDPRLGLGIAAFRDALPRIQQTLADADAVLGVAPAVLGIGTPSNYLVEQLDSTELRPGAGFIGTFGIATLSGGRLTDLHITDVDLLDRIFERNGGHISLPAEYSWFPWGSYSWGFRDSNLEADFPTSAKYGESSYHAEGGDVDVQGVI